MPQDPFAVRDTNEADARNGALPAHFAPSCAELRQMSRVDHRRDLAICNQGEVGPPPAKAIRRVSGRDSSVVARHSAACYPPTRSASKTLADAPAAARSSGGGRFQQGRGHGRGVPSLECVVAPAALFYQPPVV